MKIRNTFFSWSLLTLLAATLVQCGPGTAGPGNGSDSGKKDSTDVSGQNRSSPGGNFLSLSDIHFDPFFDRSIVMQLVQSDVSKWAGIFSSSKITSYGAYGADTNYPLFSSALGETAKRLTSPDFIIITGDFLSHNFRDSFQLYTKIMSDTAYNSFVAKTTQFIALKLAETFPKTTIIPALGNNDSDCGDYMLQPDGPYLSAFANAWGPILMRNGGATNFQNTFPKMGHYTFSSAANPGNVVMVFNSIYFSSDYDNSCGSSASNPGLDELKWIRQQLDSCEQKHLKVWMVSHIPPGADVYSTFKKGGSACTKVKTMWHDQYTDSFLNITQRYSTSITAGLTGHTHMDEFRLVGGDFGQTPYGFYHISPSFTPRSGNNPGFETFTYDPASWSLTNFNVFYFKGIMPGQSPVWAHEYNFDSTYAISQINTATLYALWKKLNTDTVMQNDYILYYNLSNTSSSGKAISNWKAYWDGIGYITKKGYQAAYCGTGN